MLLILPAFTRRPSLVTGCHSFSSLLPPRRPRPRPRPRPRSPRARSPKPPRGAPPRSAMLDCVKAIGSFERGSETRIVWRTTGRWSTSVVEVGRLVMACRTFSKRMRSSVQQALAIRSAKQFSGARAVKPWLASKIQGECALAGVTRELAVEHVMYQLTGRPASPPLGVNTKTCHYLPVRGSTWRLERTPAAGRARGGVTLASRRPRVSLGATVGLGKTCD